MKTLRILTVAVLLMNFGCNQSENTNNNLSLEDDMYVINKLRQAEIKAAENGNVGDLMDLRTEDFIAMPPGQPQVKGADDVKQFLEAMFSQVTIKEKIISEEIIVSDSLAIDRGIFSGEGQPKNGGEVFEIDGKYVWILEKQDDGSWKYAVHMWSNNSQ